MPARRNPLQVRYFDGRQPDVTSCGAFWLAPVHVRVTMPVTSRHRAERFTSQAARGTPPGQDVSLVNIVAESDCPFLPCTTD